MINWNEIYTTYLQGVRPTELAQEFKIDINAIKNKIKSEKWVQKKKLLQEKILGNCEKKLEKVAQKAFEQLEDILNDEMASSSSKIQAAKMIIDLTGFKRESGKDVTYEVYINRECVKCK